MPILFVGLTARSPGDYHENAQCYPVLTKPGPPPGPPHRWTLTRKLKECLPLSDPKTPLPTPHSRLLSPLFLFSISLPFTFYLTLFPFLPPSLPLSLLPVTTVDIGRYIMSRYLPLKVFHSVSLLGERRRNESVCVCVHSIVIPLWRNIREMMG